jgi:hypothetical protein
MIDHPQFSEMQYIFKDKMGKIVKLKQVVELKVPTTSINMVDVNASITKNKVTKVRASKEHKS